MNKKSEKLAKLGWNRPARGCKRCHQQENQFSGQWFSFPFLSFFPMRGSIRVTYCINAPHATRRFNLNVRNP